jgi:catechol 2,3-dioxygenase-like lactoylglutathione lyase family enzyme
MTTALEHVNITVQDLGRTLEFLQAALPDWRVRGEGRMDWFGKPIRWLHYGGDDHYLALQSGGEGAALDWQSHLTGVKHVGLVVASVEAVVQRLAEAGFLLDHWGGTHPHRRSAYVIAPGSVQFEFVEYHSADPALRNDYAL